MPLAASANRGVSHIMEGRERNSLGAKVVTCTKMVTLGAITVSPVK